MKKIILFLGTFGSLVLGGCLKDDALTDYTKLEPVIILPNANRPSNSQVGLTTFTKTGGDKPVMIYARLSWENTLNENLVVSFISDQSAINSYNNQFGKNFVMLPDIGYSIPSMQAFIPAGSREAFIVVTVKPSQLPAMDNYMLAFTIKDAQGRNIASNFKTIVMPIKIQ